MSVKAPSLMQKWKLTHPLAGMSLIREPMMPVELTVGWNGDWLASSSMTFTGLARTGPSCLLNETTAHAGRHDR